MEQQDGRALFENEVRLLAALESPHVIRALDHFRDEENGYLVTPFCRHGELFSYAKAKAFRWVGL